jgi:hypothetical protein
MMLTTLYCRRAGLTFAAVHDCYWTHACSVDTMNEFCRDQFIALYNQPIIEDLSQVFFYILIIHAQGVGDYPYSLHIFPNFLSNYQIQGVSKKPPFGHFLAKNFPVLMRKKFIYFFRIFSYFAEFPQAEKRLYD